MSSRSDIDLAMEIAERAGAALLSLQKSGQYSGDALGKAGDQIANQIILDALRHQRPGDAILSEEEADNGERLASSRVWIVDPLDGTAEYASGGDDWAVHIGLAVSGAASLGAVALPSRGECYNSRDVVPLPPANNSIKNSMKPRLLVSRSRCPGMAHDVAAAMGADIDAMGSAGAKTMALIRGDAEIYLHAGGQYEWDNCAPVAIAQVAGLSCTRIDGSALAYNQQHPFTPDLLICRPEYLADILPKIAAAKKMQ
jgi:3'(2'), 5'-bisphosphate nucleotidase